MTNFRILLVESSLEAAIFLEDMVREIQDERMLREWNSIEVLHAPTLDQAERMIEGAENLPHVVLLDPNLDDARGADAFRRLQALAPHIPAILLVSTEDHGLAEKLMREGAQDFLIYKHMDCAPLAHALRNAVTRHRLLNAARAATLTDSLTGLPNLCGFLALAARDLALAKKFDRCWMMLLCDLQACEDDLDMIAAAERLRGFTGPANTLARIGPGRFAIGVFDSDLEVLEEVWMRLRTPGLRVGGSIFDPRAPRVLEAVIEDAERDLIPAPCGAGA